jgi:hypothetical protein
MRRSAIWSVPVRQQASRIVPDGPAPGLMHKKRGHGEVCWRASEMPLDKVLRTISRVSRFVLASASGSCGALAKLLGCFSGSRADRRRHLAVAGKMPGLNRYLIAAKAAAESR